MKLVMKLVFSIVIVRWIVQLEFLDCRPVTIGKKGQFCKDFFLNSWNFRTSFPFWVLQKKKKKKITYSEVFSPLVGCRQYLCNCNNRKLHYTLFSRFFPKFWCNYFKTPSWNHMRQDLAEFWAVEYL